MNIYEESFLILGKGTTYLNCKEFFDKESIAYEALETRDILNISCLLYTSDAADE